MRRAWIVVAGFLLARYRRARGVLPTRDTLKDLVKGELVASPAFSPDASTIAYLAPVAPGAAFHLWTVGTSQNPPHAHSHEPWS